MFSVGYEWWSWVRVVAGTGIIVQRSGGREAHSTGRNSNSTIRLLICGRGQWKLPPLIRWLPWVILGLLPEISRDVPLINHDSCLDRWSPAMTQKRGLRPRGPVSSRAEPSLLWIGISPKLGLEKFGLEEDSSWFLVPRHQSHSRKCWHCMSNIHVSFIRPQLNNQPFLFLCEHLTPVESGYGESLTTVKDQVFLQLRFLYCPQDTVYQLY